MGRKGGNLFLEESHGETTRVTGGESCRQRQGGMTKGSKSFIIGCQPIGEEGAGEGGRSVGSVERWEGLGERKIPHGGSMRSLNRTLLENYSRHIRVSASGTCKGDLLYDE